METKLTGAVTLVGDNIDTDQIYPGRFLEITDPREIGSHCLCGVDENIAPSFPAGGIVVAGRNFGCGSSREHAPIAIRESGVACVIAKSFARIFYRNAINIGLPIMECPEAVDAIEAGDTVQVDFDTGVITDETTGKTYQAAPFPEFVGNIIESGGLLKSLKDRGVAR